VARKQANDSWCEVLAFDPGGTTGWSVMCIKPRDLINPKKELTRRALEHYAAGQIVGGELIQVDQCVELIDIWPNAAVVSESFVQRIRNTGLETDPAYSPVRINFTLKWWLATEDRYLFKQSPSDAKKAWTDERLEAAKLDPEGGHANRHARDGVRHAALFLNRASAQKGLRHRAWPQFFNKDGSMV
jgi:hypothetical protein